MTYLPTVCLREHVILLKVGLLISSFCVPNVEGAPRKESCSCLMTAWETLTGDSFICDSNCMTAPLQAHKCHALCEHICSYIYACTCAALKYYRCYRWYRIQRLLTRVGRFDLDQQHMQIKQYENKYQELSSLGIDSRRPKCASQILMVLSNEPLAILLPSGLHTTGTDTVWSGLRSSKKTVSVRSSKKSRHESTERITKQSQELTCSSAQSRTGQSTHSRI